MRNILEEFFYGNIPPEPASFKRNAAYREALRVTASNGEKLLAKLSEAEQDLLEKYTDAQGELNQLTVVEYLIYGYKLGVLMTAEAFVTGGDLIAE